MHAKTFLANAFVSCQLPLIFLSMKEYHNVLIVLYFYVSKNTTLVVSTENPIFSGVIGVGITEMQCINEFPFVGERSFSSLFSFIWAFILFSLSVSKNHSR